MTDVVIEIPRCFSISIQSDLACALEPFPFTEPAVWIAFP